MSYHNDIILIPPVPREICGSLITCELVFQRLPDRTPSPETNCGPHANWDTLYLPKTGSVQRRRTFPKTNYEHTSENHSSLIWNDRNCSGTFPENGFRADR